MIWCAFVRATVRSTTGQPSASTRILIVKPSEVRGAGSYRTAARSARIQAAPHIIPQTLPAGMAADDGDSDGAHTVAAVIWPFHIEGDAAFPMVVSPFDSCQYRLISRTKQIVADLIHGALCIFACRIHQRVSVTACPFVSPGSAITSISFMANRRTLRFVQTSCFFGGGGKRTRRLLCLL